LVDRTTIDVPESYKRSGWKMKENRKSQTFESQINYVGKSVICQKFIYYNLEQVPQNPATYENVLYSIKVVELDSFDTNDARQIIISQSIIALPNEISKTTSSGQFFNEPLIKEFIDESIVFLGENVHISRKHSTKDLKKVEKMNKGKN